MQPAYFRLIAGLGNPGREYAETRHNAGFIILDQLAAKNGMTFQYEKKWNAELANREGVLFCKPANFMNRSGVPVSGIARFYKIDVSETLVIYDDVALPLGKLRFRAGGSSGGHNGLQSIIDHFGTQAIPRLRIGVGDDINHDLVSHVLGRFSKAERPQFQESVEHALTAIDFAQHNGLQAAMNQYN